MRYEAALIICLALTGYSKIETASVKKARIILSQILVAAPTAQTDLNLEPVVPKIKLSAAQRKYLNKALPLEARKILERAEKFEVLAEIREQRGEADMQNFQPNFSVKVKNTFLKKNILEALYQDVATDEGGASCYEPRHGLHASYGDKWVDIEMCFSCAKFYVKSSFGNFYGTIRRNNRKSEKLLNKIIKLGVE